MKFDGHFGRRIEKIKETTNSLIDACSDEMKIKIKITGPKVHDVGYVYFLMINAIDMGLLGFQARNRTNGKDHEVVALVEGDDEAIADFKDLVESKKPEHAEVSNIAFDDYQGDIMRTGECAQICFAQQLNMAIPVLLEIRDNTKSTLERDQSSEKNRR